MHASCWPQMGAACPQISDTRGVLREAIGEASSELRRTFLTLTVLRPLFPIIMSHIRSFACAWLQKSAAFLHGNCIMYQM